MADRKISDLTALTAPAAGDYLPIVDISEASAANKNKRITIEELLRGAPDGTAAAPSIGFESDPNTGIYRPGADQLAISTGGTGRLFVDSSGRVGIGTTAPIATTHIMLSDVTGFTSPANDGLVVERGGGNDLGITIATNNDRNGYLLFADSDSPNPAWVGYDHSINAMSFRVNASERARIDSSGRLLVGTSTNTGGALLQVNDNRIRVATAKTPASASDTGAAGEICWDANYIYVCTATNTWKRAALSTW